MTLFSRWTKKKKEPNLPPSLAKYPSVNPRRPSLKVMFEKEADLPPSFAKLSYDRRPSVKSIYENTPTISPTSPWVRDLQIHQQHGYNEAEVTRKKPVNDERENSIRLQLARTKLAERMDKDFIVWNLMREQVNMSRLERDNMKEERKRKHSLGYL